MSAVGDYMFNACLPMITENLHLASELMGFDIGKIFGTVE